MSDVVVRAIDTRYAGYLFRSRTEARWAVFFDQLGLHWTYESEGFDVGNDMAYLPDFKVWPRAIPGLAVPGGIWIEIKGDEPTAIEVERIGRLASGMATDGYIMVGDPMRAACGSDELARIFNVTPPEASGASLAARAARFEHGQSGAPEGEWRYG